MRIISAIFLSFFMLSNVYAAGIEQEQFERRYTTTTTTNTRPARAHVNHEEINAPLTIAGGLVALGFTKFMCDATYFTLIIDGNPFAGLLAAACYNAVTVPVMAGNAIGFLLHTFGFI